MTKFDEYGDKLDDERFKRPYNKEDIEYRKFTTITFAKRLKEIVSEDCTLCFHGTPIWNSKEIIMSGNISALIDRVGHNYSEYVLNMPGQICVSTINSLQFTIKNSADLYNYKYPAGCVFVIKPKNNDEIKSSREDGIINNVYFNKTPNRLKAIITTPENISQVKSWINESGLNINADIVVDYNEFIEIMKNEYDTDLSI